MRSLTNYIVEPCDGVLYDNVKKVGESELILSSSIENHQVTNRKAIVKAIPVNVKTPVKVGATIIVHHNVFRKYNDMKGKEKHAAGMIFGDIYMVDPYQVYMYKNVGDSDWTSIDPFCFVSPIVNDDTFSVSSEKEQYGVMEYPNKYISSLDILKGDIIGFAPDSEYEFNIDGKKYYRVNSRNICLKMSEK